MLEAVGLSPDSALQIVTADGTETLVGGGTGDKGISACERRGVGDIKHVQGEELKDFVRAFVLGAGIKLHEPSRQHKKTLMVCGLFYSTFKVPGNKASNDDVISE